MVSLFKLRAGIFPQNRFPHQKRIFSVKDFLRLEVSSDFTSDESEAIDRNSVRTEKDFPFERVMLIIGLG